MASFEELLAEGEAADTAGWGFGFLEGRASEERAPWGYHRLLAERLARSRSALDIATGGGEVLAEAAPGPIRLVVTESYLPNVTIARRTLAPLRAAVVAVGDDALPFAPASFDLVSARHPVATPWEEIARVLEPGGTFLSQQVGAESNRELYEYFLGPQAPNPARVASSQRAGAEKAGLEVTDLREATLEVTFDDIGAVVYFLRKVPWTVPGFSVAAYRERLADLHAAILSDGPFRCSAKRFLIEARKPA